MHDGPNRDAGAGLTELPWIAGGPGTRRIAGYLFYYQSSILGDRRFNRSAGVVIPIGGGTPWGASAKILWIVARGDARSTLLLTARRLDGPGSFTQRETRSSASSFPSIVDFPEPGCWELTLRTGASRATVVFDVVEPSEGATCDPTPLHHEPNSALPFTARWIRTMPAPGGFYGVGSVHDGGATDEATIYARGTGPDRGREILWVPARQELAGSSLLVSGRRLDTGAVGTFRLTVRRARASGESVFPSVIDVPEPGCWLLTLRTGKTAGIAVFRAVAR